MDKNTVRFEDLGLSKPILAALKKTGYEEPTPIQAEAIPHVLKGRDLHATAQTGTGKTAAFSLPILERLSTRPGNKDGWIRCLIVTPTRELALQIDENIRAYAQHLKLSTAVIMGGVAAGPQKKAMRRRPEILIATPGRLLDLMSQGIVKIGRIEVFVLDEADRMLDMGFIHDIRKIVEKLPRKRQTLFFSATLTKDIKNLAGDMVNDPVSVEVSPPSAVADNIQQSIFFCHKGDKEKLLLDLLHRPGVDRVLVFTRTKHRANRLARNLTKKGVNADAIHSNKSQGARQAALDRFHKGKVRVLVATDIVARGIDVDDITHVVNYELPHDGESYVHRIGRTARAGTAGVAWSLCQTDEVNCLRLIERFTGVTLERDRDHNWHNDSIEELTQRRGGGGGGQGKGKGQTRRRSRSQGGSGDRNRGSSRPHRGKRKDNEQKSDGESRPPKKNKKKKSHSRSTQQSGDSRPSSHRKNDGRKKNGQKKAAPGSKPRRQGPKKQKNASS